MLSFWKFLKFFLLYRAFESLNTWFENFSFSKPGDYSTKIFRSIKPFRKKLLICIWNVLKFLKQAYARNILMDFNLTTGANVSSKSIFSSCAYPLTTSLALFLTISFLSFNLFLKTHFVPITEWSKSLSIRVHILFLSNWLTSSCMATIQLSSLKISFIFLDSIEKEKQNCLLKI